MCVARVKVQRGGLWKAASFLVSWLLLPAIILAESETFRCNGTVFTNKPTDYAECKELEASLVCTKDGNKIVSPPRAGLRQRVERCSKSESSTSPFVNMAAAKLPKPEIVKGIRSGDKNQSKPASETPSVGQLMNPNNTANLIECATKAMSGSGDLGGCLGE
jgi:hypothetical protein